jgi:carnitine O-acetyltransferase
MGGRERSGWVTDARIEAERLAVGSRTKAMIADSDNRVLWFSDYCVELITSIGTFTLSRLSLVDDTLTLRALTGLAPDAYIQMALQLAWYKSRGSFTATYETALTRAAFDKVRMETIRTLTDSEDSRMWVLSMTDPFASVCYRSFACFLRLIDKEGYDRARRAVRTLTAFSRRAATGSAFTRTAAQALMIRTDAGETSRAIRGPVV